MKFGYFLSAVWIGLFVGAMPDTVRAETLKARLEWAHTVELRFVEDGIVSDIRAVAGQRVKAGEVVASLDPREIQLALDEAKSGLMRSEAALARAERQLEWALELYDRGLISDNERLEAEENAATANAEAASAKAGVGLAEISLERTELKAPFDGVVVGVGAWPGQVVVKQLQKDPVVELADSRQMVARVRLTALRMQNYAPGDALELRVGKSGWRKGEVYRLGVESEDIIDRGAVYGLDVIFETWPDEHLRPGQFAAVKLPR